MVSEFSAYAGNVYFLKNNNVSCLPILTIAVHKPTQFEHKR